MERFDSEKKLAESLYKDIKLILKEDFGDLLGAFLMPDEGGASVANTASDSTGAFGLPRINNAPTALATANPENVPGILKPPSNVVSQVANMSIMKARKGANGKWDYKHKAMRPIGYNDYGGVCARTVGMLLSKVFNIHDYANEGIGDGGVNIAHNPKFQKVATVNSSTGYNEAQPGDVAVFKQHMHAALCLDGTTWASDTIQRRLDCYSGNGGLVDIYRYTGGNNNTQALTENKLIEMVAEGVRKKLTENFGDVLGAFLNDDSPETGSLPTIKGPTDIAHQQNQPGLARPSNSSTISDQMMNQIAMWETGHPFGYQMKRKDLNGYDNGDAQGHKTFGYGLLMHPNGGYMDEVQPSYTQQELEGLYREQIAKVTNSVKSRFPNLTQPQLDAVVSACYNFGVGGFANKIGNMIKNNPNDPNIPEVWANLSNSQGSRYPGLLKRRRIEANTYRSGMQNA